MCRQFIYAWLCWQKWSLNGARMGIGRYRKGATKALGGSSIGALVACLTAVFGYGAMRKENSLFGLTAPDDSCALRWCKWS